MSRWGAAAAGEAPAAGQGAETAGGNEATKEAAAEGGSPAAGPGAESAGGNEAPTGAVTEDEARAVGPGAMSAIGQGESTSGANLEAFLCSSTPKGLSRYAAVPERTLELGVASGSSAHSPKS